MLDFVLVKATLIEHRVSSIKHCSTIHLSGPPQDMVIDTQFALLRGNFFLESP